MKKALGTILFVIYAIRTAAIIEIAFAMFLSKLVKDLVKIAKVPQFTIVVSTPKTAYKMTSLVQTFFISSFIFFIKSFINNPISLI